MSTHLTAPIFASGLMLGPGSLLGVGGKDRERTMYFVDPANGNDSNSGDADQPVKSPLVAYNKCTDGAGDIVVQVNNGLSTGSGRLSASVPFVWAKNNTHFIGNCAPSMTGQRSRITGTAVATNGVSGVNALTPMFAITADGCEFANLEFFDDYASDGAICVQMTNAHGNYFYNCNIQGMGGAGATGATSRSLVLASCNNNRFVGCEIGCDTVARTAANSSLEVAKAAGGLASARNRFEDCSFVSWGSGSGTGMFFLKVAANGIDRELMFKNCEFKNRGANSGGVTQAFAFSVAAGPGGDIFLPKSFTNCASWNAVDTGAIWSDLNVVTPATNKGGIIQAVVHA